MKIVSCFPFFNELDLLEVRLHELNDVVDHFVLSEARSTHSGKEKPLYYRENEERFAEFRHKITALECEFYSGMSSWGRENYQRDYLSKALDGLDDEDIIILSDADEIFSASKLDEIVTNKLYPCSAEHWLYYLYVDWKAPVNGSATAVLSKRDLLAMGGPHAVIRTRGNLRSMKDTGWHFSYLGGLDNVVTKLNSFAHTELAGTKESQVKHWFDAKQFYHDQLVVHMPTTKHLLQPKFAHLFSPENRDKL